MKFEEAERLAADWANARPVVAAFVFSLVQDYHETEEILSKVAVVLVRKYSTSEPIQSFTSWAMKIARYEILNAQRAYARDRHQFSDVFVEEMSAICNEAVAEMDPRMLYLEECLKRVQGRARQALVLRYTAGMKPAKIAESLKVSGGAVRILLTRTRNALRSCVERRLAEERGKDE